MCSLREAVGHKLQHDTPNPCFTGSFARILYSVIGLAVVAGSVLFASGPFPALLTVKLAWDPSPGTNVVGYNLYVGTSTRTYTNIIPVGAVTEATVSNLVPATTYYFAVTAVDDAGLESDFSNEVAYFVPGARLEISGASADGLMLSGKAPSGETYSIWATQDLETWRQIGEVTADAENSFVLLYSGTGSSTSEFYRLRKTTAEATRQTGQ